MIYETPMPVNRVLVATLFAATALAGCGGSKTQPTTSAATTTAATTTSTTRPPAADRAACARLESTVVSVSQLVTGTVDEITNSLHPKELARRTAEGQRNVLFAARVLESTAAPPSLVPSRDRLVVGLREFARDLGRAHASVAHGNLAAAARQLDDPATVTKLSSSTRAIRRACGA
jgi:hypothetical protein